MRPISEAEITRKQWQRAQTMQDEGYILRQVGSVWTPDATPTRCTVQDGTNRIGNIAMTPAGTPADALELPYGTAMTSKQRFRLTQRSGLTLDTAVDYIPISEPRQDSISMLVDVRTVAT